MKEKEACRQNMSPMLQNKPKRETKQIRIGVKNHRELKLRAANNSSVMSKMADEALREYFEKNPSMPVVDYDQR